MTAELWLRIPYALNIAILVPVCWAMFSGRGEALVFQGAVATSAAPGLELLVGSLWLAILLGSIAGLFLPFPMAPLLAVQIVYKFAWLAVFIAPAVLRGAPIPTGISLCFAAIVATWPLFLWAAWRS
jgi:hypothetical protein